MAVKVYDKYKLTDDQRKRSVIKEIKLLKRMHHENIVALYDAIDTQRQVSHVTFPYSFAVVSNYGKHRRVMSLAINEIPTLSSFWHRERMR